MKIAASPPNPTTSSVLIVFFCAFKFYMQATTHCTTPLPTISSAFSSEHLCDLHDSESCNNAFTEINALICLVHRTNSRPAVSELG